MDLFGKFRKLDSALQRGLDNSFARVFGGEVVPTEIDELLKQQAEDSVMVDSEGNQLAPSFFVISISQRDYDSLRENHPTLVRDLSARLTRFIRNEGWTTNNQVTVDIRVDEELHTGQLKADSRFKVPEDFTPSTPESGAAPNAEGSADQSAASSSSSSLQDDDVAPGEREWPEDPSRVREVEAKEYDADSDSFPAQNAAGAAGASAGLGSIVHPGPGTGQDSESAQPNSAESRAEQSGTGHNGAEHNGTGQGDGVHGGATPGDSEQNGSEQGTAAPADQSGATSADSTSEQQSGAHASENAEGQGQSAEQAGAAAAPAPAEGEHSYPGTTVITHAANDEVPVRGGTGEPRPEDNKLSVTLTLRDGSDRRYELVEGSNLIGRGKTVDLRIPDTGVSRQHAEISWDGYDAVLTDLQSTNGTSVNGTPIENWLLADGDVIAVGHSEIEVHFHH